MIIRRKKKANNGAAVSKHKNIKTVVAGITFHSKKEAGRYSQLLLLEKGGVIKNLILQPKFLLQENFRNKSGELIRAIHYISDFKYTDVKTNEEIVEDVKASKDFMPPDYKLKKKLFQYKYPQYRFVEIFKL